MSTVLGRLGNASVLNAKIEEVEQNGGEIMRDDETVVAFNPSNNEIIFRAIEKSGGVWLIMYSTAYYPKEDRPADELPERDYYEGESPDH